MTPSPIITTTRQVRYAATLHLLGRIEPATIAELVEAVADAGIDVPDPPGKAISDALRTELVRGRVRRLARGVYGTGHVSKSTARYLRNWLAWSVGDGPGPPAY